MSVTLQFLNLHRIILIYLAVPAVIFLMFWLRTIYGICGSFLLVLAMMKVWDTDKGWFEARDWKLLVPVFVFSLMLTILSGLGGFGYQNSDHEKHNALIHDLTVNTWPLQYEKRQWKPLVYSVGMYLPATLLGKYFRKVMVSRVAIVLWVSLGLALVFFLLIKTINFYIPLLLLLFVLFGGFDILGTWFFSKDNIWLGSHIEWWGKLFQFSSHGTQIMWVPQHCIPAWLVTGMVWKNRSNPAIWSSVCLFGYLVSIWSVFASFGIAILFVFILMWSLPSKKNIVSNIPAFILLCLNLAFYKASSGDIDSSFIFSFYDFNEHWLKYFAILSLEFLPFVLVVFYFHTDKKIKKFMIFTLAVFSVLPLYRLGAAHDLAMRASIPSFYILFVLLVGLLKENIKPIKLAPTLIIFFCFALGSVASIMEFYRATTFKRNEYKWGVPLPDTRFSNQYFGDSSAFFFQHLSKELKNTDGR